MRKNLIENLGYGIQFLYYSRNKTKHELKFEAGMLNGKIINTFTRIEFFLKTLSDKNQVLIESYSFKTSVNGKRVKSNKNLSLLIQTKMLQH